MLWWVRKIALWLLRVFVAFIIVFLCAAGFGTSATDAGKMRAFNEAVQRWQSNPDFRMVHIEYVELGSESLRARFAWIDPGAGVMFLRSIPGLPPHLAVNPTSQAHYNNFCKGPLVAYLHLTNETNEAIAYTAKMAHGACREGPPSDYTIRHHWLLQYKFDGYTVVSDQGAIDSAKNLCADIQANRPFAVLDDIAGRTFPAASTDEEAYWNALLEKLKAAPDTLSRRYLPHIAQLAQQLGYPTDAHHMTAEQQHEVRIRLDDHIKATDFELWRVKQINDWAAGIWAQVYGTMYALVIDPALTIRSVGRFLGPLLLIAWLALAHRRRRKPTPAPDPNKEPPPPTPDQPVPSQSC